MPRNSTLRHLLLAGLLVLLSASARADKTVAFQEAVRHGEDAPGPSLRWTFVWNGKEVEIASNGRGSVGKREFQVPLNGTRLTSKLRYSTYNGDLLVLIEETDEESSAGKLVRFAEKSLKPKWNCGIPSFNVGPGLIEGKSVYLSARATAMKVDLDSGQWDWRRTNLNRLDEATVHRFNAFELPELGPDRVTFPEAPASAGSNSPGSVTLSKSDGEVLEVR